MKFIIDVHSHIFSARDIPLKGYLLSRNYEDKIQKLLSPILIPSIAKCIRGKLNREKNVFIKIKCKCTMGLVRLFMGGQYLKWGDTLSKDIESIISELIETFEKDEIDLFIPLMIDYEYWFKNTPDTLIKDQIDFIYENVILPYEGKFHPFVSFDPARELAFRKKLCNPDGDPEKYGSMNLVKDAIEKKGFIGVKLYNSMGYKPFNNASVDDKRRRISLHKKKYVFKGEEYDEVLTELYDYCVENEVPITTHCGMYGIESYPDASFDFGKAVYWRDVLDQEKFKNLHLNLAHFGWYTPEGYTGNITWVKDICKMLDDYNYLFTDVSCHRVVLKKYIRKFKSDYKKIGSDFPIVKERLLFGTDWHVLKRVPNFRDFKDDYIDVLKHENNFNDAEIKNFLSGNALNFLGLYKGGKNLKRLEKFYKDNNINPPEWFKSIRLSDGRS